MPKCRLLAVAFLVLLATASLALAAPASPALPQAAVNSTPASPAVPALGTPQPILVYNLKLCEICYANYDSCTSHCGGSGSCITACQNQYRSCFVNQCPEGPPY